MGTSTKLFRSLGWARRAAVAGLLAGVLGTAVGLVPTAKASPAGGVLQARVLAALQNSSAKAVGAAVALDGMGPAVDINGSAPLPPASTQKLFTAGAALTTLGPDYRFRTEVRATGDVLEDGTLNGDLVLVGGGDPTLTGNDVQRLAFGVASAGITRVGGWLYADDSRYDSVAAASGWKPGYVPDETGPLSALAVDRNHCCNDRDYLAYPTTNNATRFLLALNRAGVSVAGPAVAGRAPAGRGELVVDHESAPLAQLLGPMLKDSDNFTAEQLLKEVGTTVGSGSSGGGVEAARRVAAGWGLGWGTVADGSGLSQLDRETPWQEVGWLLHLSQMPWADVLRFSLPLACGDGTLQQRFCGTPAAGKVFAKTGTLPNVATLAGYTTTASGRRAWFSFELSGATSVAAARAAIDRAVIAITTFEQ